MSIIFRTGNVKATHLNIGMPVYLLTLHYFIFYIFEIKGVFILFYFILASVYNQILVMCAAVWNIHLLKINSILTVK